MDESSKPAEKNADFFNFFNEIGIIAQLSRTLLEARLPDGMTAMHFFIVNHLIRVADGRTPLDLARAFQVPKTSMTHSLAADKRSKQIWLTDKGRKFREDAIGGLNEDFERLAGKIDRQTLSRVLPDLTQVRKVLDADRD